MTGRPIKVYPIMNIVSKETVIKFKFIKITQVNMEKINKRKKKVEDS